MNYEREIYEGWTVKMFIEDLEPAFNMIMSGQSWQEPFKNDDELKRWCVDNQPHYKKSIPEVLKHFKGKMKQFKRS